MISSSEPNHEETPGNVAEEKVACQVCLSEIPVSSAKSEETSDYVAYFCGLDCYEKWRKGQNDES